MRLHFRPADPNDVAVLVDLYEGHYRGGYSACFDRYGPATPQDFWWVQSEKSVAVVELNRKPVGLIVIGRSGKRLLAEEVLLKSIPADGPGALRQVHEFLTRRFQQERQEFVTVRGAETNAAVLALARSFGFRFANALVVATGGEVEAAAPASYHIRRAGPADGRHVARLHEETMGQPLRGKDLEVLWRQPDVRVVLAEREEFPVGLLIAQVKDGAGRWTVGVREGHRSRGLGRALAQQAFHFFRGRRAPALTTYWGTDAAAARFIHALGAKTERVFLYFERPL